MSCTYNAQLTRCIGGWKDRWTTLTDFRIVSSCLIITSYAKEVILSELLRIFTLFRRTFPPSILALPIVRPLPIPSHSRFPLLVLVSSGMGTGLALLLERAIRSRACLGTSRLLSRGSVPPNPLLFTLGEITLCVLARWLGENPLRGASPPPSSKRSRDGGSLENLGREKAKRGQTGRRREGGGYSICGHKEGSGNDSKQAKADF